ncbi:MAG: iron oxidase [Rhodanobacteraceae bacterium]|nr:MAG: iron oxidase [Rhodanobacteraceae bacterium]
MKKQAEFDPSRRQLLKVGAAAAALGAVVVTGLVAPRRAFAQAAMSKATAMYQDQPHGKDMCSNCIHFIPGKSKQAPGTCKVVEGSISPNGWCVAYAPKAS